MDFQKELETYRKALTNWVEEGRWTLILSDEIAGVFDTFAEAVDHGYEKYGLAYGETNSSNRAGCLSKSSTVSCSFLALTNLLL